MAINIKFDLINNPEPPTLILANRNGNKLGQLDVNSESVELIDRLNEASEISFTVNKYIDGELTPLWDKLVDFKLVYCKEWDCWFEAKVELDEATESVKTVFCTQLGQAELSQIMLYDIEINTEIDIERDDYKIAILYDPIDSQCILSRLLEKAPHYSVIHVDETLWNIQRSFSFDSTSIYDAFQEIAEEIGCLFVFHSDSDENGMPQRTITVRDLQQNCNNKDCGYRGEFTDKCPKCGSTDITYGYGKDTLIFVTSDELASEGIQLVTDTDSVKNCFKLEAGDDLMTATIRNRNPNGTDYIWYFSDATKEDMPDELVEKIEKYDKLYSYYYTETNTIPDGLDKSDIKLEKPFALNSNLVSSYNKLVEKYKIYYDDDDNGKKLETIPTSVMGFASLMQAYYDTIDLGWYLKSGLMPNVKMGKTNAEEQGALLSSLLPPLIAVTNLEIASKSTANSAVLAMAKAIVDSSYKVVIDSSSYSNGSWSGRFTITNYSDENDTYTTGTVSRTMTDWDETYIQQKIDKVLSKENTNDLSITGLFEKDYDDFCAELKKYALNPLISFHDACQACLDILIEQGVGSSDSWGSTESGSEGNLYEKIYTPYLNKLRAIEAEMKVRENEVNLILGVHDSSGRLTKEGMQTNIEEIKLQIQSELNFEKYLGEDLWLQFCAYRREDKYSNPNYISDGLNNAELFERALQFYEVAENEIFKSSELQHSISATLNNLLAIPKFKSLVESFEVGNWIRVQVDDYIYKLRLVEYEISYGDFKTISVKFSDVAKTKSGYSDLEDILNNASSMATSYDSIQRQANLGNEARDMIRQWLNDGLDASLVQIQNNTNEDIVIDNNGLIGRSYSDITEEYSPEQVRLTHNIIAFTDDNWETVTQAIGKHKHTYYDEGKKEFIDAVDYGMSANFVTAGVVSGSQIIGGNIYSDNYSVTNETGSYINLRDGTFSFGGGILRFENGKLIISSKEADSNITEINEEWIKTTSVYAENLNVNAAKVTGKLEAAEIDAGNITSGTITGRDIRGGSLLIGDETKRGTYAEITSDGVLNCNAVNVSGDINGSSINGSDITGGSLYINGKDGTAQITSKGELICTGATISGTINATDGTFNGTVYADSGEIGGCSISGGVLQVPAANITGDLIAGSLQGGSVLLLDEDGYNRGYIDITSASSADYAVALYSDEALRITANDGDLYLSGQGKAICFTYTYADKYHISCDGDFIPADGNAWWLGSSNKAWLEVYAFSYADASDRKKKNSIEYNMEKYEDFFFKLKPTQFKFNEGTSDRYHTGFISQDVGNAIVEAGLSTQDFGAFIKAPKENMTLDADDQYCDYYLRYDEFISLNTHMIQKLYKRVEELESKLKPLS